VAHLSVETAGTTVTQQTIAIILRVVSSVGTTTPQTLALRTKTVQPNVPFAWAIIPPTTEDAHHLKHFSNAAKRLIQKPQNPNTELSPHNPKTPPPQLFKVSLASVADFNTIPLPNSHTSDMSLAKFISVLSSLINPLITLFTASCS